MAKKAPDKLHAIKNNVADIKFYGQEPTWESAVIIDDTRGTLMSNGLNWYHYMTDSADHRAFLVDWLKQTRPKSLDKDLKVLSSVSDKDISPTRAAQARMFIIGFPLIPDENSKIWQSVYDRRKVSALSAKNTGSAKNPAAGLDPDREWLLDYKSVLDDGMLEVLYNTQHTSAAAFAQHYKTNSKRVDGAILEIQTKLAIYQQLQEVRSRTAKGSDEEQLLEGYSRVTPKALKAAIKWLTDLEVLLNSQKVAQKVARVVKKKPVDKTKLVRKLQYLDKLPEWKLTSIKPEQCLGASEVWVYNTQTRKLGVYRSEHPNSLSVKGASIVGFSETRSQQKTLRKPQDQVAQFMGTGSQKLTKWFDGVGTTPHAIKGRSSPTLLLLRVF